MKKQEVETPWSNITDVLPGVLSSIVKVKNSRPKNIDTIWKGAVDPKYVNYTRIEKVVDDTLFIKVLSGALYSELVLTGADEMLAGIHKKGVFSSIKRIVYRR
jgi:hypothetical protein